jgi:hypothetical protein
MRAFAECARIGDPQLAEGVGQLFMPSKPAWMCARARGRSMTPGSWSPMLLLGASGTAWGMADEAGARAYRARCRREDGRRRRPPAGPALRW